MRFKIEKRAYDQKNTSKLKVFVRYYSCNYFVLIACQWTYIFETRSMRSPDDFIMKLLFPGLSFIG